MKNEEIMEVLRTELDRLVSLDESAAEFFPTQPGLRRQIGELRLAIARMAHRTEGVGS